MTKIIITVYYLIQELEANNMNEKIETATLISTIIACISNIIAICVAVKSLNISISISALAIMLFLYTIVHLYVKFKNCNKFLNFIVYLFDQKFNILPKICLAYYNSNKTNNLDVNNLSIKYTWDMTNINFDSLEKDTYINYTDTIEYELNVQNKKLPKNFVCFLGNMASEDGASELSQKYGTMSEYQKVPTSNIDKSNSKFKIQCYYWELEKRNIDKGNCVPICFKLKYPEKTKANAKTTILLYPRQYAKKIDNITFTIDLNCNKDILKKVELFKIHSNGEEFENIPVRNLEILHNTATYTIKPNSTEYEAYYFRVSWELV